MVLESNTELKSQPQTLKSAKKVGNFKWDILNDFSTIVCEDPDSFLKTGFEHAAALHTG